MQAGDLKTDIEVSRLRILRGSSIWWLIATRRRRSCGAGRSAFAGEGVDGQMGDKTPGCKPLSSGRKAKVLAKKRGRRAIDVLDAVRKGNQPTESEH
jgi:hypothetical protein